MDRGKSIVFDFVEKFYFYENGKLWSWGEYTEGVRNGLSSVYYDNGVKKMEGNYKDDKQVGIWQFYDRKGNLIKEANLDEPRANQ